MDMSVTGEHMIMVDNLLRLAATVIKSKSNGSDVSDRLLVGLYAFLGKNQRFNHTVYYDSYVHKIQLNVNRLSRFGVSVVDMASKAVVVADNQKYVQEIYDIQDIIFLETEADLQTLSEQGNKLENVTKVCVLFDVKTSKELSKITKTIQSTLGSHVSLLFTVHISSLDVEDKLQSLTHKINVNSVLSLEKMEKLCNIAKREIDIGIRNNLVCSDIANNLVELISIDNNEKFMLCNGGAMSCYERLVLKLLYCKYKLKVADVAHNAYFYLFLEEHWSKELSCSLARWKHLDNMSEFRIKMFSASKLASPTPVLFYFPEQKRSPVMATIQFADKSILTLTDSTKVTGTTLEDAKALRDLTERLGTLCYVGNTIKFNGNIGVILKFEVNMTGISMIPSLDFCDGEECDVATVKITDVDTLYEMLPLGADVFTFGDDMIKSLVRFVRRCIPADFASKITDKSVIKFLLREASKDPLMEYNNKLAGLYRDITFVVLCERGMQSVRDLDDGSSLFGVFNAASTIGIDSIPKLLKYLSVNDLYTSGFVSAIGCTPPFPFTKWTRLYKEGVSDVSI